MWVCLFGGVVVCSLQQWFEYSSKGKKHTCPICKQGCRASDACRLYFQSVGDANNSVKPSKCFELEEDAGVLRREVKRLEVKVSGLNSQVEGQTKELEGLNEEVFLFYFILFMAAFRRVLRREVKRLEVKIWSLIEFNDVVQFMYLTLLCDIRLLLLLSLVVFSLICGG